MPNQYYTQEEADADKLLRDQNERAYQLQLEQQHYDRWLQEATTRARQPYLDQAREAESGFSNWTPPTYAPAAPFQAPDRASALADPAYQFLLRRGELAIDRLNAGRGTVLTGRTLQELQDFGQDSASKQYDKVSNRAQDAYTLAETLRGQAFDRDASAGYQSAQLRNANAIARMNQYLGLAQYANPGDYPGFPSAPPAPVERPGFTAPILPTPPSPPVSGPRVPEWQNPDQDGNGPAQFAPARTRTPRIFFGAGNFGGTFGGAY